MKRILFFLIILIVISPQSIAQRGRDALYLKNGSIVHGKLIEIKNGQYSISTSEGLLFTFSTDEVEKFILGEQSEQKEVKINDPNGFGFGIESGFLISSGGKNFPLLFSFNLMATYTLNTRNTFSFATGAELFDQVYMPLIMEYRFNILKNNVSPFIYIRGGGLLSLSVDDEYEDYKGGWTFGAGTGFRWPIGGFESYIRLGYRYGFTVRDTNYSYLDEDREKYTYHSNFYRLEMKWGFKF
jgi:hypothetical protein